MRVPALLFNSGSNGLFRSPEKFKVLASYRDNVPAIENGPTLWAQSLQEVNQRTNHQSKKRSKERGKYSRNFFMRCEFYKQIRKIGEGSLAQSERSVPTVRAHKFLNL